MPLLHITHPSPYPPAAFPRPLVATLRSGYLQPLDWVMEELVGCLDSPALALLQWNAQLAVARSRLPQVCSCQRCMHNSRLLLHEAHTLHLMPGPGVCCLLQVCSCLI